MIINIHKNHFNFNKNTKLGEIITNPLAGFRNYLISRQKCRKNEMTRKIRELIGELEIAGFENRGGKGSHRNYVHPAVTKPVTIFGKPGDDAKHYQERAAKAAIEESQK